MHNQNEKKFQAKTADMKNEGKNVYAPLSFDTKLTPQQNQENLERFRDEVWKDKVTREARMRSRYRL